MEEHSELRMLLREFSPEIIEKKLSKLELTPYLWKRDRIILFKNVEGWKVFSNLCARREYVAKALNIKPEGLIPALIKAKSNLEPIEVEKMGVSTAPFLVNHHSSSEVDLAKLPIPTYFPEDGGPYFSSAIVIVGKGKHQNVSFHRMMVLKGEKNKLVIRIVPRHLYARYQEARKKGKDLDIIFVVGVHPALLLAAATSTSPEINELEIANALYKEAYGEGLVFTEIDGIPVPSHAEWVFKARITAETREEGKFVDITGTYDKIRLQPVVEVEEVYYRDEPLFHALLPGGYEHYLLMGMPRLPLIYESVKNSVPFVKDVTLTPGGCSWLHGVVSIRKQKEGDGKNALLAAFSAHPSMKHCVVVDEDINIHDLHEVEWAIATRFQADRDLILIKDARGSSLDPSAHGTTAKMGIDATIPFDKERKEFIKVKPELR